MRLLAEVRSFVYKFINFIFFSFSHPSPSTSPNLLLFSLLLSPPPYPPYLPPLLLKVSGPYLGATVFAWSETNGLSWPFNYYFTFYLVGAIALFSSNLAKMLPRSIQRRKREPKRPRYTKWDGGEEDEEASISLKEAVAEEDDDDNYEENEEESSNESGARAASGEREVELVAKI